MRKDELRGIQRWVPRLFLSLLLFCLGLPPSAAADAAVVRAGDELLRAGNTSEALALWTGAATAGDLDAAYRLGIVFADAEIGPRDAATAAKWFRVGAEAGHARSQFDLATLYESGQGVEQSVAVALLWYRKAAAQGESASQFNLGSMYEDGFGVEQDLVESYKWFALSSAGGFKPLADPRLEALSAKMTPEQIEAGQTRARKFQPAQSTPSND